MREPDNKKMRIMLAVNANSKDREYILDKMSDDDLLYEFHKVFGASRIPLKEVE
tara:strand:+ start:275 stop:436 length:162 start_codon:yes stop_codon:yes gene_type:complete